MENLPPNYSGGVFVFRQNDWASKNRCCVTGCSLKYDALTSYHCFPKDRKLNEVWKIKCHIRNNVSPYLRVCGKHFLESDFVKGNGQQKKKYLMKTAVPSRNLPIPPYTRPTNAVQNTEREQRLLKRQSKINELEESSHPIESEDLELPNNNENMEYLTVEQAVLLDVAVPEHVEEKGIQVNTLGDMLPKMSVMNLLRTETQLNSWTGIPTFALLHTIEDCVCTGYPEEIHKQGLTVVERILLVFIKLKTNLSFDCITSIFCIVNSSVSRIFNSMLPMIKEAIEGVVYFPSSEETKANLPTAFRKYGYEQVRVIIDCSEVKIQILKCVNCRISTYSRYKCGHTFKFMLAITPGGLIAYVSRAYSGKASDKFIFNQEMLIEKFDANNDVLMMDKRTLIEDELLQRGLQMVRLSFFRSELGQFEEVEQICNTKIASLRVNVENALQRMNIFAILRHKMSYNILQQVDNIVVVCAAIANLTKPTRRDDKFQ